MDSVQAHVQLLHHQQQQPLLPPPQHHPQQLQQEQLGAPQRLTPAEFMSTMKETTGSVPLTPPAPRLLLPSLVSVSGQTPEPEPEVSTLEDQVLQDNKFSKR